MAAEFLRKDEGARTRREGRHRNVSGVKVAQWIGDIKAGKWEKTHQGIAVTNAGEIIDGRHRIHAVYHCGIPIDIVMAYDINEEEAQKMIAAIDCGRPRTASVQLWIAEGVEHSTIVQPAINSQMLVATLGWKRDSTMSIQGVAECYKEQRDMFNKVIPLVLGTKGRNGATLGPVMWYATKEPDRAYQFLESYVTGANLAPDSPVLWFTKAVEKYGAKFKAQEWMTRMTCNAIESYHLNKPMLAFPTRAEHGIEWLNKFNPPFREFFLRHVQKRIYKAEQKLADEMWT